MCEDSIKVMISGEFGPRKLYLAFRGSLVSLSCCVKLNLRYAVGSSSQLDDLEEAIEMTCQAISIMPSDSKNPTALLQHLGCELKGRFEILGQIDDVDEAIVVTQQAIQAMVDDSDGMRSWLKSLRNLLQRRFMEVVELDNLRESIDMTRWVISIMPGDREPLTALLDDLISKLKYRSETLGERQSKHTR